MLFPVIQESERFASGRVEFKSGGTSNMNHVNLGFKPKFLCLTMGNSDDGKALYIYDETYSTTKYRFSNTSTYASDQNLGASQATRLYSIDDDGFTVTGSSSSTSKDYFAIG